MRAFVLFILVLLFSLTSHAKDPVIKSRLSQGKTQYLVEVAEFPYEQEALKFKSSLKQKIDAIITIHHSAEDKLYYVTLGPVADLDQAKALEEAFNQLENKTENKKSLEDESFQEEKKLWNLRNADIRAVIAEVSRITGKNFVIDPRVQGKISIVSSSPISNNELYQVFLSVLQISGYAAVDTGSITKIIPNIDAKTVSSEKELTHAKTARGDDMLVEVIPVYYVPAEQLIPVLRPLMPQWSSVSAYGPSNMLILSGRANNVKSIAAIIKQVDSPSSKDIKMIPLRHALAMDIVNTLKELVKPEGNNQQKIILAADDRSNSILLSGPPAEQLRLRILIQKLDKRSPNGSNSNTKVVYLNYLRAEDLVPILAGIAQANFSGTVGTIVGTITRPALDSTNPASSLANNSGSSGSSQAPSPPPATPANTSNVATQNEGGTKPNVQIIAEPNTNAIILNAPVSLIQILTTVIKQLDILPAQLLIEALVAEVNESDISDLGIEWGSNQQTGIPANFRPGFAIINSKTSIQDFQAQLYALANQRKANILSTPSVVVLDNRQAKILVGKQVSVSSTTYPNNASGMAPASPYTTFDRVNVALHLYVRPQITHGQGIQLQIDQGNDTLDPTSGTNTTNPTFNISSIVTSVHVESGDIVVLGGLTQNSLGNNDLKLPILGDIPGIGRLFQRNINDREKRVLMVFIRPIILRSETDSYKLSGHKYNGLRKHQLNWIREQDYDARNNAITLPALKTAKLPRPFTPLIMTK